MDAELDDGAIGVRGDAEESAAVGGGEVFIRSRFGIGHSRFFKAATAFASAKEIVIQLLKLKFNWDIQ